MERKTILFTSPDKDAQKTTEELLNTVNEESEEKEEETEAADESSNT